MEKTVTIYIAIDDVPLEDLNVIQEALEALLEGYKDKRINMSIQDEPLVKAPTFR